MSGATGITEGRRRWITVSIMLATVIQVLDTTIANVALPHMQGSLGAGSDQITWVLTSYIVAAAIMTLPVGYLSQRFGRRRLFLWSVAGFTVTSMLCGQAGSLNEMIFWRLMQGVFGAALVPLSQATLLDTYPPEQHASAMGLWGVGVMIGPVLGPTLGGWLTEYYSWRWVFYINLPFGILSLLGIYFALPERETTRPRFDALGFGLLALAVGALQMLLDRGEQVDWFESLEIQGYAIASALGLYLFVVHSLTTKKPFLSPGLFRDRNYVSGLVFIFVVGIILLATMALLPSYLQQWKGYPVVATGLVLMPRGLGVMVAMILVGRLLKFVDGRALIVAGMFLVSFSLHLMAGFNLQVSRSALVWTGVLQGFGLGLVFVPISTLAYATLPAQLRGEATALFSLSRNLGSSVGVSIVMAVLTRNLWINEQQLGEHLQVPRNLAGTLPNTGELQTLPLNIMQELSRQSAEIAYVNDFQLLMWINLAAVPLVFLLANPRRGLEAA
ncbi:DHA2 family efflux MFS transporter permease subunit [Microbulbifer thermotolerans]|uniref:DHA2 family efflux MFS transporter permease subunit n=2 Tax=Microbulbifer thermotolerans TaxID=252514 RepID=UPI002249609C|nr:DHA2 family efflux MFS transporter permease subunit [Microbulbifer thermotolerans]MCX2781126.1 DHA2 family efflux MFS transporter permease subunit [Microbulbifer thermotolerans]MCX2782991.1 DHA2 family efflux MFS transporter permease subunit [Microbulbifer thermotolerans]MCX2795482.1 DHA2 family efflux MFS transporter permease subunit [Microbulbifer thermotolerans]MCX2804743.1 DHA2 family efflux MFS transporter permease subunit [Microbulbifer thermotolerans]MCX2832835.1 DHA2 family efflux M